jgi:hypothetical protein
VQFFAGEMLLLRYQFSATGAGRWQLVRYNVNEGELQRRAVTVNTWGDLQRWQNTPQAWLSVEPQNLVTNIRTLSWQVLGQQDLTPANTIAQQNVSQAQNMGALTQRLGVRLTLDLNNGERFVRQWGVRE